MATAAELDDPIPISALQHAVYCLRQAALIHIERAWAENRFTAEGRVLHDVAHEAGERKGRRGVRRVTALPIACRRLNIAGVADLVEFRAEAYGETAFPVEYKRGKPKLHRADEVQLCAQALCLEEMTGRPVPEGALFYGETKRRVVVPMDAQLRRLTEETAMAFGALVADGRTPPPVYRADRCRACSLIELCRPKAMAKSALGFRNRAIAAAFDPADDGANEATP
jgi:CRISPR-associated exonuclease Cas4